MTIFERQLQKSWLSLSSAICSLKDVVHPHVLLPLSSTLPLRFFLRRISVSLYAPSALTARPWSSHRAPSDVSLICVYGNQQLPWVLIWQTQTIHCTTYCLTYDMSLYLVRCMLPSPDFVSDQNLKGKMTSAPRFAQSKLGTRKQVIESWRRLVRHLSRRPPCVDGSKQNKWVLASHVKYEALKEYFLSPMFIFTVSTKGVFEAC